MRLATRSGRRTGTGGALELGDDGGRAAEKESVPVGCLLQFAFVWSGIDPAIDDILPVQAALGPVLPARIWERGIGFLIREGDVRDTL